MKKILLTMMFAGSFAGLLASGCATADEGGEGDADNAAAGDNGPAPAAAALRANVNPVTQQISAADRAWSFVDVPESRCANGEPTGFGINPASGSDELIVYFQGGGACWNLATCGVGTASNLRQGYTASDFDSDGIRDWALFNRADAATPFRAMNQVIVPYCTGDVHAGTRAANYGLLTIQHRGAQNVEAMLTRIKATFPGLRRIIMVGTSAGGFGAQLNYPRFVAAYPSAQLDVVADSAQLLAPRGGLSGEWAASWGLVIPGECVGCIEQFPKYVGYLATKYPTSRFGLFASLRDVVLTPFFNFGINAQAFRDDTAALLLQQYDPFPRARYLARSGLRHGYLSGVREVTSRENIESFAFLRAFVAGTAVNKRPF
jgi:hypothetical protein